MSDDTEAADESAAGQDRGSWSEWAADGLRAAGDMLGGVPLVGSELESMSDGAADTVEQLGSAPEEGSALRRGSAGDLVRQLQEWLAALGFDPGPADGDFGPRTEAAVCAQQAACGAEPDGLVSPTTWESLITAVQQALDDVPGLGEVVDAVEGAIDTIASGLGAEIGVDSPRQFEPETVPERLPGSIPGVSDDDYKEIRKAIVEKARIRLGEHEKDFDKALTAFLGHAPGQIASLDSGDADVDLLDLVVGISGVLLTIFAPGVGAAVAVAGAHTAATAAVAVGTMMKDAYDEHVAATTGDAKQRLHAAVEFMVTDGLRTSGTQWQEAVNSLGADVDAFFQDAHIGDFTDDETQDWVCDQIGIPDRSERSCFEAVLTDLEVRFAGIVATVKSQLENETAALKYNLEREEYTLEELRQANARSDYSVPDVAIEMAERDVAERRAQLEHAQEQARESARRARNARQYASEQSLADRRSREMSTE